MSNVFDPEHAAAYYDDAAVADCYQQCRGGEDIHIGLIATGQETAAGLEADARAAIAKNISRWQAALAEGHITRACFVARKSYD